MALPYCIMLEQVALQERKELISLVIATSNKAVRYEHNATLCPVCLLIGVQSVMGVASTVDETRYCSCRECGATVKAIGVISVKTTKTIVKIEQPANNDYRKSKKGRKNGNSR